VRSARLSARPRWYMRASRGGRRRCGSGGGADDGVVAAVAGLLGVGAMLSGWKGILLGTVCDRLGRNAHAYHAWFLLWPIVIFNARIAIQF